VVLRPRTDRPKCSGGRETVFKFLYGLDSYERHRGAGYLLKRYCPAPASVLDVGGEVSMSTNHVGRFAKGYQITTANVKQESDVEFGGGALPFEDDSFDAVVSIDTVEHVPPADRAVWLGELFRVARKLVAVVGPIGSEFNLAADSELNELHRELHGTPHVYMSEHVANGCPQVSDIESWSDLNGGFHLTNDGIVFDGDTRVWKSDYATMFRIDSTGGPFRVPKKLLFSAWTLRRLRPMRLSTTPDEHTHRFYAAFVPQPSMQG